ncbi:hypothetical protein CTI12_AA205280 [Artemisia annua]|uniref:Uncharacterized protein n=1 Tax=Artemisia annua TaxID=35608 RepID=A0A2U1P1F2_ARTAN|nr:hypothetical protein CTI12_AA205280 [Artemisia annua]
MVLIGKPVQLNVFIDKQKNKVMFAEADEEFVEILFSLLILPLGTIAKLLAKHADPMDIKVGSFTSLYQSVAQLDVKHFTNEYVKNALVNPVNSTAYIFHKLKLNLDTCVNGIHSGVTFLKEKSSFIITDDLKITPFLPDKSIEYLSTLGVECINSLRQTTIHLDYEEFTDLLKWSLLTDNALTNFVNGGSKPYPFSSSITNTTFGNLAMPKTVKLLVQKSTKKLICAQVDNFFVEMLFSYLTIPLGAVIRLTRDNLSPVVGMHNVYNSILILGDGNYLKSDDIKYMLLRPKLASIYNHATDFLPIYEQGKTRSSFLKEQATFIVSDDLQVALSLPVSTISNFSIGVPVGDIEVREASIGEREALSILKASLTSTTVLTDCLKKVIMEPKAEPST